MKKVTKVFIPKTRIDNKTKSITFVINNIDLNIPEGIIVIRN